MEDLLNPNMHFEEEAELEDFGLGFLIIGVEVAGAVKQLGSTSTPEVDDIRPKLIKALDVLGLSW